MLTLIYQKLRQATLIIPKTGQRVKRNVTFRRSPGLDGASSGCSDETQPLLGGRNRRKAVRDKLLSPLDTLRVTAQQAWTFANSKTGRGVFKCSVAYFLGSLATFVPMISAILGRQGGKHTVATITVYFHPARSKGSMVEAMICATCAFLYAVFICFSSMGISIFFGRTLDAIVVGHVIVLIVRF